MLVFSTHAFTEGDEQKVNIDGISTISTHAFTEGDNAIASTLFGRRNFNSRLHGRRLLSSEETLFFSHFNSRLHGRRRAIPYISVCGDDISTHAFTEGDAEDREADIPDLISTHAFTEGDEKAGKHNDNHCHFNSRLHGRRLVPGKSGMLHPISTHAFTEGDCKFK